MVVFFGMVWLALLDKMNVAHPQNASLCDECDERLNKLLVTGLGYGHSCGRWGVDKHRGEWREAAVVGEGVC